MLKDSSGCSYHHRFSDLNRESYCKCDTGQTFNSNEGATALTTSIIRHLTGVGAAVCDQKVQNLHRSSSVLKGHLVFVSIHQLSVVPEPVDVKFW